MEGYAVDRNRLGIAHEVTGQVDDVYPQINEGAAAGTGLVAKPAHRVAVAPQIGGFGKIDVPQCAFPEEVLQNGAVVSEAADKSNLQQFSAAFGSFFHGQGILHSGGHGLFAQDVFAGIQRCNGAGGVLRVPGADADSVQFRQSQHFIFIGKGAGHAVFFRHERQLFFVDVTESVQLHPGIVQISLDVFVGNISDADDADFQLFHEMMLLIQ